MQELSLHILDITENAVAAGARQVFIAMTEDRVEDRLMLEIRDDGTGMDAADLKQVLDPFFTPKKVRRVGLGLPLLAQAAEDAGGGFRKKRQEGRIPAIRKSLRTVRSISGTIFESEIGAVKTELSAPDVRI